MIASRVEVHVLNESLTGRETAPRDIMCHSLNRDDHSDVKGCAAFESFRGDNREACAACDIRHPMRIVASCTKAKGSALGRPQTCKGGGGSLDKI